jgi:PII-like signaling protein
LAQELPIIVEVVDRPEAVAAFVETISPAVSEGLITVEDVGLRFFRQPTD